EPLVELEPRGPPAVPEHRPRALAPHPAQPARAALPGGPRAARGLRQRQRLPPSLRRGPDPDAPRDLERRYLVPQGAPRAGRPARRLLLRQFGLHSSVPIYSGGLGVLAGDQCKASSDLGVPMVGVGLFYMKGYFDQRLRLDGWQQDSDEEYDITRTPLEPVLGPNHEPILATVETAGRPVYVRAWRVMVGRIPVYLLDTNVEMNHPADRGLMNKLYAGGPALRLQQEWILGAGGVRVLRALGINPSVWHANEGHAAFMMIERMRECAEQGMPFSDALRAVRARSIFTTHTPVPAGHDAFDVDEVAECMGPVWEQMGVDREALLHLGYHPAMPDLFHMTATAIRCASRVNGVSRQHGQLSRHLWRDFWPGRPWET